VTECPQVPPDILWPRDAWKDANAYDAEANKLALLFIDNFKKYEAGVNDEVRTASPRL
jgi:phosphoenolpyruvate carboxykinase (ATP)